MQAFCWFLDVIWILSGNLLSFTSVIFNLGTSVFSDVTLCRWVSSYVSKIVVSLFSRSKGPRRIAAYENMKTELGKTICLLLCWNQSQRVKTIDWNEASISRVDCFYAKMEWDSLLITWYNLCFWKLFLLYWGKNYCAYWGYFIFVFLMVH